MKFEEALQAMRDNKKVTCIWLPERFIFIEQTTRKILSNECHIVSIKSDLLLSEEWKIVE